MPKVTGRKKTSTSKKSKRGRKSTRKSATGLRGVLSNFWEKTISATATAAIFLGLVAVLMLFAGGYFWNVGDRVGVLTSRAAKAIGFSVSRVTVRGAENIADAEIMSALWDPRHGAVLGRSLLHIDGHTSRARIEQLGWVEHAAVQKLWPNTIQIAVHERVPRALWQTPTGDTQLLDGDGNMISSVHPTEYTGLPIIAGVDNPKRALPLFREIEAREELMQRVAVIVGVGDRRFDLRFRNDFTAKLPQEETGLALDRLVGLGAGTGKLAETLDYIDLRDPQWAFLKEKSQ